MDAEQEILDQLRLSQHDDRAWGQLMERYRGRLKTMVDLRIHALVRRRVDPSDIIQEAMIDASRRLPEYLENPAVPFYVWLRLLTGQRLSNAHRQNLGTQSRNAAREISIDRQSIPSATSAAIAAELIGQMTSPSQKAVEVEQKLALQQALDELSELDREILVLRHFEDLSNSEAAAVLGLQPTAANNRYIRALGRLKSVLRSFSNESELKTR